MDNRAFNADCLAAMREMPDNAFDLAVVDPVYGDVTRGGYMKQSGETRKGDFKTAYHKAIWEQEKTGKEYFDELFRISKNQVIWGGVITSKKLSVGIRNAGWFGISKTTTAIMQIVNLHGLLTIQQQEFSGLHGTASDNRT